MINVSVLIATLNEAENLPRCLAALKDFDEIIVIDSGSTDGTQEVAQSFGVRVEDFNWNGDYPKKRQWSLDNLAIKHDFIFFVDGDEELTPALVNEIQALDFMADGYFIKGQYVWDDIKLKHGLKNNKLAFFNRHKIEFPAIDDLDIDGMGEIEGHYQPVLKTGGTLSSLNAPMLHHAYEDRERWEVRHQRYAEWEAEMIRRDAYPKDPDPLRQILKSLFRRLPFRGAIAFCHSYIINLGFLDGAAGYGFARSRMEYYRFVSRALKTSKASDIISSEHKPRSALQK